MPQTSPFNWTLLLVIFLITLILIMSKISFISTLKNSHFNNKQMYKKYFSWMW